MARLYGIDRKEYASLDFQLSVSDIYLEDTIREPNDRPITAEFVKVDFIYHYVRNDENESLSWDLNETEPSHEDVRAEDILLLVKTIRKYVAEHEKVRTKFEPEGFVMFDIEMYPESKTINTFDIATSGSFGVDDMLVLRLFPRDESLIEFADALESETYNMLKESRLKFPERVNKAKDLIQIKQ